MSELLAWTGFFLLLGTYLPFLLRRLPVISSIAGSLRKGFARYHHSMALGGLLILAGHGLLMLSGGRGWQWGRLSHWGGAISSGVLAWLVMLLVVFFAFQRNNGIEPFHIHCWLAGLLVLLVLVHVL
ncbi:hypothetical protein [Desulfurispora thermophila]|uniref:hypothetical protein n=1 Tax=Desulfurispora thermophila TaxID=265470 RepID=UPI0003A25030|nr:hypothetical protein [Desulfurispora thermophila]